MNNVCVAEACASTFCSCVCSVVSSVRLCARDRFINIVLSYLVAAGQRRLREKGMGGLECRALRCRLARVRVRHFFVLVVYLYIFASAGVGM